MTGPIIISAHEDTVTFQFRLFLPSVFSAAKDFDSFAGGSEYELVQLTRSSARKALTANHNRIRNDRRSTMSGLQKRTRLTTQQKLQLRLHRDENPHFTLPALAT